MRGIFMEEKKAFDGTGIVLNGNGNNVGAVSPEVQLQLIRTINKLLSRENKGANFEKVLAVINEKLDKALTKDDFMSIMRGFVPAGLTEEQVKSITETVEQSITTTYMSDEFVDKFARAFAVCVDANRRQEQSNTRGLIDSLLQFRDKLSEDSSNSDVTDKLDLIIKTLRVRDGIVVDDTAAEIREMRKEIARFAEGQTAIIEGINKLAQLFEKVGQGLTAPTTTEPQANAEEPVNNGAEQINEAQPVENTDDNNTTEEETTNTEDSNTPASTEGEGNGTGEAGTTVVGGGTRGGSPNTGNEETPENKPVENEGKDDNGAEEGKPEEGAEGAGKPTPNPTPVEEPQTEADPAMYFKVKLLKDAIEQTTILSERKRPWYSRLKNFTANHPILTGVIGAGIGLGITLSSLGLASVAGWATATMWFGPSLAIGSAIGALGGAGVAVGSRLIPAGRRQSLAHKFAKQHKTCLLIDRAKELSLSVEKTAIEKRKEARQRHRESSAVLKKLGIHRAAVKYHDVVSKISRKMGRFLGRMFKKQVVKTLDTKEKLNDAEIRSGKTVAVNGYLQKMRNLESKKKKKEGNLLTELGKGKITQEEYDESMQELEEDFDVDAAELEERSIDEGYDPGLRESRQLTGDVEALSLIEKVQEKHRTGKMKDMKNKIMKRNSRNTKAIEEVVIQDPRQTQQKIDELRANGNEKEAAEEERKLTDFLLRRKAYKQYAAEKGLEYEPPIATDKDGNPINNETAPEAEKETE